MRLVPLTEGCGVDLYNGGFGEGVGADEFVVRGMIGHRDDTHFPGYAFGAPGEVAGVKTEGTIFLVAAAGADEMDTLGADSCVGWLTAFLERSVKFRPFLRGAKDVFVPLLAVICTLCASS